MKRHEKDARRAPFLALRVCLLELFSSRARCDSLSNQLFGKRDNASRLVFIVFRPFVSKKSVIIAVFSTSEVFDSF